jgi:putative ABC transport system permease protein
LAESLVLAAPAALLGVGLARAGLCAILTTAAVGIPRASAADLDLRVLAFTVVATLGTLLLFGLAPALRASRFDLNDALRDGSRSATSGPSRQRLRGALVAGQMALSVVLLLGAGLMLRSRRSLAEVDLGFRPEAALSLHISLPSTRYPEPSRGGLSSLATPARGRRSPWSTRPWPEPTGPKAAPSAGACAWAAAKEIPRTVG